LNADAQNWDENDRLDVISGLPDVSCFDVVEMGSGIGRFTKYFAEHGRSVVATDFIESFVQKNIESHSHYGNVTFKIVDAVNHECDTSSCDLVFTNWLLMYLSDAEVIEFCMNALEWIRPGGYFHIRESCTEPSTKAPKKLVKNENPTYYRHASVYMHILGKMGCVDPKTGLTYRFQLQWAKSIPTYVSVKGNWRQVHMILRKVETTQMPQSIYDHDLPYPEKLFAELHKSQAKQTKKDLKMRLQLESTGEQFSPLDTIVQKNLVALGGEVKGLLNLNASILNSFALATSLDCCVEGLDRDYFAFSALLGEANNHADKRVRFQWTDYVTDPWKVAERTFDGLVGVNLSALAPSMGNKFLHRLRDCLKFGSHIVLADSSALEPNNGFSNQSLKTYGFELLKHENISPEVKLNADEMIENLQNEGSELALEVAQEWTKWSADHPQWSLFTLKAV